MGHVHSNCAFLSYQPRKGKVPWLWYPNPFSPCRWFLEQKIAMGILMSVCHLNSLTVVLHKIKANLLLFFCSQPSAPQALHARLPVPHAHRPGAFPTSLLWHDCRWVTSQLHFQAVGPGSMLCAMCVLLPILMANHDQGSPLQSGLEWLPGRVPALICCETK